MKCGVFSLGLSDHPLSNAHALIILGKIIHILLVLFPGTIASGGWVFVVDVNRGFHILLLFPGTIASLGMIT